MIAIMVGQYSTLLLCFFRMKPEVFPLYRSELIRISKIVTY